MDEIQAETKSRYLTEIQIEAVKEELEHLDETVQGFVRLLTMIDHYVRSNEKADAEYEAIYTLVTTLDLMQSKEMHYGQVVSSTYPLLSAISFYDFLLVTGVLSPSDIRQFKNGNFNPFGGGGIAQA